MDINQMTRKQFEALPIFDFEETNKVEIDSVVLLPTRRVHSSGYRMYSVVACKDSKAIGRLREYDIFGILTNTESINIDCLKKLDL